MEAYVLGYVCFGMAYAIVHLWNKRKQKLSADIIDKMSAIKRTGIPPALIAVCFSIATIVSVCLITAFWPIVVWHHLSDKK